MSAAAPTRVELEAARDARKRRATELRVELEIEANKRRGAAFDAERVEHAAAEAEFNAEIETRCMALQQRTDAELTPIVARLMAEPTRADHRALRESIAGLHSAGAAAVGDEHFSWHLPALVALVLFAQIVTREPATLTKLASSEAINSHNALTPAHELVRLCANGAPESDVAAAFGVLEAAAWAASRSTAFAHGARERFDILRFGGSRGAILEKLAAHDNAYTSKIAAEALAGVTPPAPATFRLPLRPESVPERVRGAFDRLGAQ